MVGSEVSASPMVAAAMKVMDPQKILDGLSATVAMRFRLLILGLAALGYGRVRLTSGLRSLDTEMVLYGKGRTKEECLQDGVPKIYARPAQAKVTWIQPCESKHVKGYAVDVTWMAYTVLNWDVVARLASDLGILWGGNWIVKDRGHFELDGGVRQWAEQ